MADRSLKGTGLGAKSFEDEAGVEFAARQEIGYDCPRGHHFSLVFRCRGGHPLAVGVSAMRCRVLAFRRRAAGVEGGEARRLHWDMLRERRSIAELEDLLAERLNLLRSGGAGLHGLLAQHPLEEDRLGLRPVASSFRGRPRWSGWTGRQPGPKPGRPRLRASCCLLAGSRGSSHGSSISLVITTGPSSPRSPLRPWSQVRALDALTVMTFAFSALADARFPDPPRDEEGNHLSRVRPGPGQDEDEPDDVGDETRKDQQQAADQDEDGVGQVPGRHATLGVRVQRLPGSRSLVLPDQPAAKAGNDNEQQNGRQDADRLPDLDGNQNSRIGSPTAKIVNRTRGRPRRNLTASPPAVDWPGPAADPRGERCPRRWCGAAPRSRSAGSSWSHPVPVRRR